MVGAGIVLDSVQYWKVKQFFKINLPVIGIKNANKNLQFIIM